MCLDCYFTFNGKILIIIIIIITMMMIMITILYLSDISSNIKRHIILLQSLNQ